MSAAEQLTKPSAPFLYKYSSPARLDWLRAILFEHWVYFPSPSELKDPTDARPRLIVTSKEGCLSAIVNPFLVDHKWDPVDSLARDVRNIVQIVNTLNHEALGKWVTPAFHKQMLHHRIYSMTTRPDNEHLWTEYAGDHTGYCLEFHNLGPFGFARTVSYHDVIELDFSHPETIDATFLFRKTRRYEPEEEVRVMLFPRGQPHEVTFEPRLLRRVILGRHMNDTNRRTIRDWCATRDPELQVAEEEDRLAVVV